MKKVVLIAAISGLITPLFGQVSIGSPLPSSGSILDLSNGDNLGLRIPQVTTTSALFSGASVGLMYYFQNNIYYRTSGGYNAISPWRYKYNLSTSNNVYLPSTIGNVGIGLNNPVSKLHITGGQSEGLSNTQNGHLMIGLSSSSNIVMDANGIQARSGYTSSSPLYLNWNGGLVRIGSDGINSDGDIHSDGDINADGKLQENGHDLLPSGVVVMWSGSVYAVPDGWSLCDGGSGRPDLRLRFVLGAGSRDKLLREGNSVSTISQTTYSLNVGATGGADRIILEEGQLPSHNHSEGSLHTPGYSVSSWSEDNGFNEVSGNADWNNVNVVLDNVSTWDRDIDGSTGNTGSGNEVHAIPPYYVLAYIIKD